MTISRIPRYTVGMPILRLYPLRFRDPVTGKMVKARYVATLEELRERYEEFEIIGAPEIRDVPEGGGRMFQVPPPRPRANVEISRAVQPRRPQCWTCSQPEIRSAISGHRARLVFDCQHNGLAPLVDDCSWFVREPDADDGAQSLRIPVVGTAT